MKKLIVILLLITVAVAFASDPKDRKPATITADRVFKKRVEVGDAGNTENDGILKIFGQFAIRAYKVTTAMQSRADQSTAKQWSETYNPKKHGTILLVESNVASTVAIIPTPAITEEMDGTFFGVKKIDMYGWTMNTSTAVIIRPRYAHPRTQIESTRGTESVGSDTTLDSFGDFKLWMADYRSSGTSTWIYIMADQCSSACGG